MRERLCRAAGQSGALLRFIRRHPGSLVNLARTLAYQALPFALRPARVAFSPVTYTLYLNNFCNYKCEFCFLTKRDMVREEMGTEDFHRIVTHPFNRHAYRVTLGGGEPFLHTELFNFAKVLKEHGTYVSVYTNGSFLGRDFEKLRSGSLDCVNVSHYDEKFDGIEPALREICSGKGFPAVRLSKIVTSGDLQRMEETIGIALKNRIPMLIFKNYQPHDGEHPDLVLMKGDLRVEAEIDRLKGKYRDSGLEITWPNLLDPRGSFDCRNPSLNIIYGPGGTIAPCCFIVPPSSAYGELFSSRALWNSEAIMRLRRGNVPACNDCYFRHGLQNRLA